MASLNPPVAPKASLKVLPKTAPVAAAKPAVAKTPIAPPAKTAAPAEVKVKLTKEETTAKLKASQEKRLAEMGTHPILGCKVADPAADRWISVDTLRAHWVDSATFFGEGDATVPGSRAFMVAKAQELATERGNERADDSAFWNIKLVANAKWQARTGHPLPGWEVIYKNTPEKLEAMKERLAKGRETAAANRAAGIKPAKKGAAAATEEVEVE